MTPLRRHLSYANVVATVALVFAMGGSAIAANRYLINSTKQINPKVLKKLKAPGRTGPAGSAGPRGLPGTVGLTGSAGSAGGPGVNGLSALSSLPSGQSESGDYGIGVPAGAVSEIVEQAVTFPIPLAADLSEAQVIVTRAKTPVTHCPGPGQADKGFLCVYRTSSGSLNTPFIKNPESEDRGLLGTGRLGFYMEWTVTEKRGPFDIGTYTVTAP